MLYANGQGVRQKNHEAINYLGKACDLKYQQGCDAYAKYHSANDKASNGQVDDLVLQKHPELTTSFSSSTSSNNSGVTIQQPSISVPIASKDAFASTATGILIGLTLALMAGYTKLLRTKDRSAVDSGRYVAAYLLFIGALSVSVRWDIYSNPKEFLYQLAILELGLYVIGFCLGFGWAKGKAILKNPQPTSSEVNESHYTLALKEYESMFRKEGLWAKCFSESNGDEAKTKALYIAIRAKQLTQSEL